MLAGALALLLALAPGQEPTEPGLSLRVYYVGEPLLRLLPLVPGQTPNRSFVLPSLDLASDAAEPPAAMAEFDCLFLAVAEGFLVVDEPGRYVLRLESDDGSRLALDGATVIDHDGLHSPCAKEAEIELAAGAHPLEARMFQAYGGWVFRLSWKRPGASAFEIVPTAHLACPAGEVRVTAPGKKKVLRPLSRTRPGTGRPLEALHPGPECTVLRPEGFEPRVGGLAWLPDGTLLVSTWDADGSVWALSGTAGDDAGDLSARRFASGLCEPLGLAVVGERVFVLQKQELTELVDLDGDGTADEYRALCAAWDVSANFHEFAFGLLHRDGWLYFNLAIAIDPGGRSTKPQVAGRGDVLRVAIEDGRMERLASGLRTPNGIGNGPEGSILITDNQGDWLPSSKLVRLEPGAFYGSRAVLGEAAAELPVAPPVLWLPQNEIGNSPSNPVLVPEGFGPWAGQVLHGDVTHGGIKRDVLEVVDGVWQGAVLRWTQGLEAGVNRIAFGPDGALYVGGIGSTGNWGQEGKQRFGLERLRPSGAPCFEVLSVSARSNGFEVTFTEPIAEGTGWESENWRVASWRYVPTEAYGGPKVDERKHVVRSASVAPDRRSCFVEVEGLEPGRVVHLEIVGPIVAEDGRRPWTGEAWYTLNRLPAGRPGTVRAPPPPAPQNVLAPEELRAGWRLLFDGRTLDGWHLFRRPETTGGWRVEDGTIARGAGGGDLVTREVFGDFELALEWRIAPGGNSGVFFHVADEGAQVWESGPEMQVLDNERHLDGQNPLTSAGSNYALHAPPLDASRPVGMWNAARIVVRGGHVEHWLNGEKLLEYELGSEAWRAAVAASKFASMPLYGRAGRGRIALQDHGDPVWYRDVRVRVLD